MSKNKRNFFIGQIGSGIMFSIGVLYLLMPNIYGINDVNSIDTNNLFISMIIVYSCIHLGFFYVIGKNPTNEDFILSIISMLSGVLNVFLTEYLSPSLALSLSVLVLILSITAAGLFESDYYHDRKDAYYYIELFLTIIMFVTGTVISISLFNDTLVQTIELGFLLILFGIIESVRFATKCLLKAPRFLGKIKF